MARMVSSSRRGKPQVRRRLLVIGLICAAVAIVGSSLTLLRHEATVPELADAGSAEGAVGDTLLSRHIYSEAAQPGTEIVAALAQAGRERKRVLLDFGGDWCGDCQLLDLYLRQSPNRELLAHSFVVVHVFVGHLDRNLDITARYNVPIANGVPALAVLDASGNVLNVGSIDVFEKMRSVDAAAVTGFLERWKA